MSIEDYLLNALLVALVVRQVRGKRLTPFGLLWPVALVAWAGAKYLRGIPTAGHDVELVVTGAAAGAVLGCLCGALTRLHDEPDGTLLARATGAAAALWVLGVGARLAFALYAENGGGPEIARFGADHGVTGAAVWAGALVAMSLAEVLGRTVLLCGRAWRHGAFHGNASAGTGR